MKYSVLGSTGVKVSRICLGTATFGVAPTAQDADRVVGAAIDLGINFVDTADVYGNMPVFDRPGAPAAADREPAEQILGRALRGRRDEMVIATKSNGIVGLDINDRGLSRRHIIRQVETSLRRLETDYIDLYYAHDPDPDTPLEQTLAAYDDLIRQGKIRYVGLSNHPAWQVTQALWIADDRRLQAPVAAQVKYNLIDRAAERELGARLPAVRAVDRPLRAAARRPARRPGRSRPRGLRRPALRRGRVHRRRDRASPGRSTGSAAPGDWRRTRCRWPGCCPARPSPPSSSAPRPSTSSAPTPPPPTSSSNAAQLDALTALATEPAAFHHRAGDGPERPPATDRLGLTDELPLDRAAQPPVSQHQQRNPSCLEPTRPPSIF